MLAGEGGVSGGGAPGESGVSPAVVKSDAYKAMSTNDKEFFGMKDAQVDTLYIGNPVYIRGNHGEGTGGSRCDKYKFNANCGIMLDVDKTVEYVRMKLK